MLIIDTIFIIINIIKFQGLVAGQLYLCLFSVLGEAECNLAFPRAIISKIARKSM